MARRYQLIAALTILLVVVGGVLYQGVQSTVFFYTPDEVLTQQAELQRQDIRVGALVEEASTRWDSQQLKLHFRITDGAGAALPVVFAGVKPDLYREGQGIVVEGRLLPDGVLEARQLLVKHSEEYQVPGEVGHAEPPSQRYRSLLR